MGLKVWSSWGAAKKKSKTPSRRGLQKNHAQSHENQKHPRGEVFSQFFFQKHPRVEASVKIMLVFKIPGEDGCFSKKNYFKRVQK